LSLWYKTALLVFSLAIANVAIGYAIHRRVVAPEFVELENNEAEQVARKISEDIRHEAARIDVHTDNWATWDDSYEFGLGANPQYMKKNIEPALSSTLDLDWIIVLNREGKVISGPVQDSKTGELLNVPELPDGQWDPSHPLLIGDTEDAPIAGVIRTSRGPVIVASRDILRNDRSGPSSGRFVMGRWLDQEFLAELDGHLDLEIQVLLPTSDQIPASIAELFAREDAVTMLAEDDSDAETLHVFTPLMDLTGEQSLIVHTAYPREITRRALTVGRVSLLLFVL